jgi:hypothetical protein
VLALTLAFGASAAVDVSAHRRDEYLQAARLAIDPARVEVFLDLTPGIALADAILADIDRNRDGSLSAEEQQSYARVVMGALQVEIDGRPLHAQLDASSFPDVEAVRRGEGTIRLHSIAPLPPLPVGAHHLTLRNGHHRDGSVYLANALVPESDRVAVTAQRRDGDQRELIIDYVLHAPPAPMMTTTMVVVLVGGLAGVLLLFVSARRIKDRRMMWVYRRHPHEARRRVRRRPVAGPAPRDAAWRDAVVGVRRADHGQLH